MIGVGAATQGSLPQTGSPLGWYVALGVALLLTGLLLVRASRRRTAARWS